MISVKRLTPNKIANLVMADEAWHDSEYIAASDYDALSAELAAIHIENDTLRAELESAHAAQRHAEKELSQYMAWYAMAEHQHLHEQRRAERAEQEAAGLRAALEAITRRAPIMGSTGPYREGQLDALEACREIASAALEESK